MKATEEPGMSIVLSNLGFLQERSTIVSTVLGLCFTLLHVLAVAVAGAVAGAVASSNGKIFIVYIALFPHKILSESAVTKALLSCCLDLL